MRKLTTIIGIALVFVAGACRRNDWRSITVDIPAMDNDVTEQIVKNAVANEFKRNDAGYHADLRAGTLMYSGSAKLRSSDLQQKIVEALRTIDMKATIKGLRREAAEGTPDRYTLTLEIEGLTNKVAANVAVAACARGLRGKDDPAVVIDRAARRATVRFNSAKLSIRNIEHAIANAGLRANDVPARLNDKDALKHGW